MKYAFLFIALFTGSICIAQSGGSTLSSGPSYNTGLISSNDRYSSVHHKGFISYNEIMQEYEDIEGSPYLHGGEILVDLIFLTDSIIKNVPIRYDQYNNEIIAKKEDGSTIVLDQNYYAGFIHNNDGEEETYFRLAAANFSFCHVLFRTSDFVFYKTNKIRLEKVDRYVPGMDVKKQRFLPTSDYFVVQKEEVHSVRLRNGEAMAYFPKAYAAQVPKLKKELKIKKLRKQEDYVRIINAFDDPD